MSSHEQDAYTPPQDTGPPDQVETDPAALSSAEDLDEDRLRQDPLETGMDPPEHWTGADKYGTTPYELAHPRSLDERLGEEQPDVTPAEPDREPVDRESVEDAVGGDVGEVSLDEATRLSDDES